MDSLITAAARALAAGDPLSALNCVALRDDPPALALRGIAMAQLGDLKRARSLLRRAGRAFGDDEPVPRARCMIAEVEIALVSRDLGWPMQTLQAARATLQAHGDRANAAHAGYLEARRCLLIGRLDQAQLTLEGLDPGSLRPASHAGASLVSAGVAMRRIRAEPARLALEQAAQAANEARIPALVAEVDKASLALQAPAARLVSCDGERSLRLQEFEALLASNTLVIDACRAVARAGPVIIPLAGRPVLFSLARVLAEAWPGDVSRETLLARAFGARCADESHRARLRVEIGRLRKLLEPLARLKATKRGFALYPVEASAVVVTVPPVEGDHPEVIALLADGEAWSSSGLALALGISSRTAQRALETLAAAGKAESFGQGRACRWILPAVPGFPTSLSLHAALTGR